jgi:phage shock protein E
MQMIIDVRTPEEFTGGHVRGSINIPLDQIEQRWSELNNRQEKILLCCASGNRSGMAARFLQSKGINCENAGSWMDLKHLNN